MRGLRYRFFDRLLESIKSSAGYRVLFHRVFDLLDFYKLRRFLSMDINGTVVPSVIKIQDLNTTNVSGTWTDYIYRWDWSKFGKLEDGIVPDATNAGAGLSAPFSLSSHGYIEVEGENGGTDYYYLYFMDLNGKLSVDYDVPVSEDERNKSVFFVWAKLGTSSISNVSCLKLDTDELRELAFKNTYISFSGSTVLSPNINDVFYSKDYSEAPETTSKSTDTVLPRQGGNTSVARFREEALNRGNNDSNVFYAFNEGETGSPQHIAQDYLKVKSYKEEDTTDNVPTCSVIVQDNIMLSPGDVWFSNYEYYYEFRLHLGDYDSTKFENFSPNAWTSSSTSSIDKTVYFQLKFFTSALSSSDVRSEFSLPYDYFNDIDLLRSHFIANQDSEFYFLTQAPYGFNIFIEDVSGGSVNSKYDIVFRAPSYFNVTFESVSEPKRLSPNSEVFAFSRYTSYYNFAGLMQFAPLVSVISDLFKLTFDNGASFDYTPAADANSQSNLDLPTFDLSSGLLYGVLNTGNVHDLFFTDYLTNNVGFPSLVVTSDYKVSFVDSITKNNDEVTSTYVVSSSDTDNIVEITDNPVKVFNCVCVPLENDISNQKWYSNGNLRSTESDLCYYYITDFLQKYRNSHSGFLDFTSIDFQQTNYRYTISASFFPHTETVSDQSNPIGIFPTENVSDRVFNGSPNNILPYQYFSPSEYSPITPSTPLYRSFLRSGSFEINHLPQTAVPPAGDSFLWLGLTSSPQDNNEEHHLLVGDYAELLSSGNYTELHLVLAGERTEGIITHKYYYLSSATTFDDNSYKKTIYDYVSDNNLDSVKYQVGSDTYYFENEVAKDFYTGGYLCGTADTFQNPMSYSYLMDSSHRGAFCKYVDSTVNLYVRVLGYSYGLPISQHLPIVNFFSHFGSTSNFFVHDLCSNFFDLQIAKFYLSTYSLSFHHGGAATTTKRPLFLGENFIKVTQEPVEFSTDQRFDALYMFNNTHEDSGTASDTPPSFDFRYMSLRFNDLHWTVGQVPNSYFIPTSGKEVREFYYPIQLQYTSNGTTTTNCYILKVTTEAIPDSDLSLYPYCDSFVVQSQYANRPLANESTGWVFQQTNNSILSSSIRPLVYPAAENAYGTSSSGEWGYYDVAPNHKCDFVNFFKPVLLDGLCIGQTQKSDDKFPHYVEFKSLYDSTSQNYPDIPEYLSRGYSGYDSDNATPSFELIDIDESLFTLDEDLDFQIVKISGTAVQFRCNHSNSTNKILETSLFLNQKVPLAYILNALNFNTALTYSEVLSSLNIPQDATSVKLTTGSVTISANTRPIKLRDTFNLSQTTTPTETEPNVDLIDISVKAHNPVQSDFQIVSSGYDSSFGISFNDTTSFNFMAKSQNSTCSSYSYFHDSYQVTFDKWSLLTLFYQGKLSSEDTSSNPPTYSFDNTSTTKVSLLAVYDELYSQNLIPLLCSNPPSANETISANQTVPLIYFGDTQTNQYFAFVPSLPFSVFSPDTSNYYVGDTWAIIGRTNRNTFDNSYKDGSSYTGQGFSRICTSTYPTTDKAPDRVSSTSSVHITDTSVPTDPQFSKYYPLSDTETGSDNFVSPIIFNWIARRTAGNSYNITYTKGDITGTPSQFLMIANVHDHDIGSGTDSKVYEAVPYSQDSGDGSTWKGKLSTNCANLDIARQHFQTWCPFIGKDSLIPEGEPTDDTTKFNVFSRFDGKGVVLSFNGREAYLSASKDESDEYYALPSHYDTLTIERYHSRYSWDLSKTLDSIVDFNMHRVSEVAGQLQTEQYTYEISSDETDTVLNKEQTIDYYHLFTPARVDLGVETNVDLTPTVDGGGADDESLTIYGGGGADL